MNRIICALIFLSTALIACQDKWEDYYKQKEENSAGGATSSLNLLEYLKGEPEYSEFVKLLEETGVSEELTRNQILTIWAPTNETMPKAQIEAMSAEDKMTLCKNHINYIALYNTKLSNDKIIKSLAGKNLKMMEIKTGIFSIDGVEIAVEEQGCANGVIHEVKGWILPRLSVFEYMLRAGNDYSLFRDSILAYSDTVFKPSQSFILGTDSLGNTIYDSVFVTENKFLDAGNIRDEDKDYTLFLPSNQVINDMYREMGNSLQGIGKQIDQRDSLLFFNWMLRSSIYDGRIAEYAGTFKSVYDTEWRSSYQKVNTTPNECSNGLVYNVEKLHVPKFIYMSQVDVHPYYIKLIPEETWPDHIQNSKGEAVNNFTTMDKTHNVLYQSTGNAADFWVEFDTYTKDNAGNVIEAKLVPGVYTIKASHRTYMGKNVQMLINETNVGTYNAGSGSYSYKAGLVNNNFEVKEEWAGKMLRIRFVNVGKSDRICIEYIRFEPTDDNY